MKASTKYILIVVIPVFVSCHEPTAPTDTVGEYVEPYPWQISTPQEQGLDSTSIRQLEDSVQSQSFIYSFLIVKNGFLVLELYNGYFTYLNDYDVRSVTKSFISALVGIAVREKYIDSVGQTLLHFFPEYDTPDLDPRKRAITIEHLLTMRAGFDYTDGLDYSVIFNDHSDWMKESVNLPLKFNPGETFSYASIEAHLLSGIVTRASGMSTRDFAQKFLLGPAHIPVRIWDRDPQGYYSGGSGMNFTPRDMARFGYLYLNNGFDGSQSIIPSDWIRRTVQPSADRFGRWGDLRNVNYGYLWWLNIDDKDSLYFAAGFGGQFIIVLPTARMVIVSTCEANVSPSQGDAQSDYVLMLVTRLVLPAVIEQ
jgi:CubicO group peptidase (beta-lactamase class C family)